jgi:hypothetical protein
MCSIVDVLSQMSYVVPLKARRQVPAELLAYLERVARLDCIAEVIVVDGSAHGLFADFDARRTSLIRHVAVDADLAHLANGKVAGVLTGLRVATSSKIVLADEDVRYDTETLLRVAQCLDGADLVRPQNYFEPLPWHACLDSARTLINRVTGGDWPGTFGVRRAMLLRTGGYDGNVLFENLELVRTVTAAGGREVRPLDLFVRRVPPVAAHFWSQRVRQAYDEFARPLRLLFWLSLLPVGTVLTLNVGASALALLGALSIAVAETGRRVGHGRRVFPFRASLVAPIWVLERAICVWAAVAARVTLGGVPYGGRILARAATSPRLLKSRHAASRHSSPLRGAGQRTEHRPLT